MRLAIFRIIFVMVPLIFLAGCATEKNIPMPEQFWQSKQGQVAVVKTKTITPALYKTGNQGLLDYAINSAMTSQLNNRISKSDVSWYQNLPQEFVQNLKKRNKAVTLSDAPIDDNKKMYQSIATRLGTKELLVINLEAFGAVRNYYSFIPTGAPIAHCQLSGELIDTATNKVIWRHRVASNQVIQGKWDQPPLYPNVTAAIQIAANNAKEELLDSFFSGH